MSPANQKKSDHSKYVYFQPGEIIFTTTHTDNVLSNDDVISLIAWSNERAGAFGLTVQQRIKEEALSFYPNPDSKGPILLAEAPQGYQAPRAELLDSPGPFTILLADVRDRNDPAKYVESDRLAEFIARLDDTFQFDIESGSLKLSTGTTLKVVSPNWLSSPSSEMGGGGGPGSRPVPFAGTTPPEKSQYEFHLPPQIEQLCKAYEERGDGVTVAILDTAPSLQDLALAYEKWQKVDPISNPGENYPGNPPKPHGLIETLLKPNGQLTVYPASYEELTRMRSVHLMDHNYNMTDHGLFIAGIVHSIAPAAKIHLYEVLNSDGVGDLKSIALGLSKVLNEIRTSSTPYYVVNCSLVLNIPLLNQSIMDLDDSIKAKIIKDWDVHKNEAINELTGDNSNDESLAWLTRQAQVIGWICDLIYAENSRVIAAAGNDNEHGRPTAQWPQARYPAAFESVKGVGALEKRNRKSDPLAHAEYSDRSDRPEISGITTLGGEKGPGKGVLGTYIGRFPRQDDHKVDEDHPEPKNDCDWAWWAGTSFASPIISGVIAAVLSSNPALLSVEEAILALYSNVNTTIGPFSERVVEVTQGPQLP